MNSAMGEKVGGLVPFIGAQSVDSEQLGRLT